MVVVKMSSRCMVRSFFEIGSNGTFSLLEFFALALASRATPQSQKTYCIGKTWPPGTFHTMVIERGLETAGRRPNNNMGKSCLVPLSFLFHLSVQTTINYRGNTTQSSKQSARATLTHYLTHSSTHDTHLTS